jgi:hypothetical protein
MTLNRHLQVKAGIHFFESDLDLIAESDTTLPFFAAACGSCRTPFTTALETDQSTQAYHSQCLKIHHISTVDHRPQWSSSARLLRCEPDQYQAILNSEHTFLQFSALSRLFECLIEWESKRPLWCENEPG